MLKALVRLMLLLVITNGAFYNGYAEEQSGVAPESSDHVADQIVDLEKIDELACLLSNRLETLYLKNDFGSKLQRT